MQRFTHTRESTSEPSLSAQQEQAGDCNCRCPTHTIDDVASDEGQIEQLLQLLARQYLWEGEGRGRGGGRGGGRGEGSEEQ